MRQYGYAGKLLRVDLSSGNIMSIPTAEYTAQYLGGRGIAARIYWDEVSPRMDAFDPENRLIFITGPVCGVPGFASRSQVCGKSAITNQFSYCSLGGSWGACLRSNGYDGVVVHGKAEKPVYLCIDSDKVEIRNAEHLKGMGTFFCEKEIGKELGDSVRILTIGTAGDNMVRFATIRASEGSCGSGGLAAVMGSKNLKAIALNGNPRVRIVTTEKVAYIRKRIQEQGSLFSQLMKGSRSSMIKIGQRAGAPESMVSMGKTMLPLDNMRRSTCFGCPCGCVRATYEGLNGDKRKFMCQAATFYKTRAKRYYGETNDIQLQATELCDNYGLDTRTIETMIIWLGKCHEAGVLTDEWAGIPLSKIGSYEFIEALTRQISHRQGFGDLLARGCQRAAEGIGKEATELGVDCISKIGTKQVYDPRLYITTAIFYAVEPRLPIQHLHEVSIPVMLWTAFVAGVKQVFVTSEVIRAMAKKFMGSEMAVDFSTYSGKAQAAAKIQDREYAKESLGLCDLSWPIFFAQNSEDHVGDCTLESQICGAVTGREIDEAGLYKIGERILNLQRAILVKEGHIGRQYDYLDEFNFTSPLEKDFGNPLCIVPGENGEILCRKGMTLDRKEFEKMKDEFYQIRGWDVPTGLQKRAILEELNLNDVAQSLGNAGLLANSASLKVYEPAGSGVSK
jgi:aldehyde:ferredoxin oxidoreductase